MAPLNLTVRQLIPATAGFFALLLAGCATDSEFRGPVMAAPDGLITVASRAEEDDDYTASIPMLGAALALNEDRPESYTVVRGDTLWDISGRFLEEPWRWREVWGANPAISNPHLIYPGDEIRLEKDANGKPTLVVTRDGVDLDMSVAAAETSSSDFASSTSLPIERLSPQIREESLEEAIPTIPSGAIRQFLAFPRVVSNKQLQASPYIIGNYDGRLTSAQGHEIYARGLESRDQTTYGIYRRSKQLRDPLTREVLGQEVSHIGSAKLLQLGDPSTLVITSNKMETISGDRLMSAANGFTPHRYIPRTPQFEGNARVVSLVDAISQSGRNQIVVLNLGKRNSIAVGDVLAVERRGGRIHDRFSGRPNTQVRIPNTRTGVVMVFQTFDKVSYALVMESSRPIHRNDVVTPM